jgi:hypothetical protein
MLSLVLRELENPAHEPRDVCLKCTRSTHPIQVSSGSKALWPLPNPRHVHKAQVDELQFSRHLLGPKKNAKKALSLLNITLLYLTTDKSVLRRYPTIQWFALHPTGMMSCHADWQG